MKGPTVTRWRSFPASILALPLFLAPLLLAPAAAQLPPVPMPPGEEARSPLGRMARIVGDLPAPPLGAGLVLREDRVLYRCARSLRERYPYLVAANEEERSARHGIELRWPNLHLLLEPIPSEAAAVELVRTMEGGEIVPDRAAFDRLVDAARRNPMPAGSWEVTIHPRVPERFGLAAERTADGFAVRGTIFTTSGTSALSVVEVRARFPAAGPFSIDTIPAISGPPQSWQTAGEADEERQRLLHRAVAGFREALLDALRIDLTLETVAAAYTEGVSFASIRRRIGEPLQNFGSGREFHAYRLGDGRAIVFAVTGEDAPVGSAALHEGFDLDTGLGKFIEALRPRAAGAGSRAGE